MTETFSSQSTDSFRELLTLGQCSLLVTTYQAGQVVMVRPQGQGINTHFMAFDRPMGVARRANELTIGGASFITTFRNLAAVGPKVGQGEQVDACYIPRKHHITGQIDIHEMGYDKFDKLWFINTKMSCLATLDNDHSFKPEWRPPFITEYDLTDRCHLNGLGFRDGVPRYVSMLGAYDEPGGWRKNKISGGQIMDITNNEVMVDGLCMPHSPRWYNNALWFLSSGSGQLMKMELGKAPEVVAELPGFTRGLDFIDRYAIIGLSQIRESSTFAGLPLTKKVEKRQSGVWVVDTSNGQIVAFLVFTGNVQEVFEVKVLPHKFAAIIDQQSPFLASSYELPDFVLNNLAAVDPVQAPLEAASRAHVNGELNQALKLYEAILKDHPKHPATNQQYGVCLADAKRWADAIIQLQKVLEISPDNAEAMNALGTAYAEQNNPEQAMHWFDESIATDQQFAMAHHNRGKLLLKQGNYKEGWVEYDWRWQTPQFVPFKCDKPQWQGEDISDKTILVHSEQGNGDHIMFWRFLKPLADRCKEVIYFGPENLAPLVAEIEGVSQSRVPGALSTDLFDVYCPLMSLPRYLDITLENLPAPDEYVKVPQQAVVSELKGQRKIGLSWSGSPSHINNQNRSIDLADLLTVTAGVDAQFYSLQMPITADERALLKKHNVIDLEPELPGYARTAALVDQMDLVVSVDTAIAHLAAALGKETWILLCSNADWRWHSDTSESPWYPSAQLFRQQPDANWDDVLRAVFNKLIE
ncbi:TIGR03032 family protein [Marinicella sp. S1101]|uniref:TIGR03032 family protein n=1 Tax=Marinicella marina TaxID=2996016 RepID=UPI002260EDFE|nr:TIGR03032 family protein [Marinicella marina]MCX7553753.1 TIGR03032 family protein [Marinicella marina]MDJ1140828.1 TIGR03032 family protein [Marinicella marina]